MPSSSKALYPEESVFFGWRVIPTFLNSVFISCPAWAAPSGVSGRSWFQARGAPVTSSTLLMRRCPRLRSSWITGLKNLVEKRGAGGGPQLRANGRKNRYARRKSNVFRSYRLVLKLYFASWTAFSRTSSGNSWVERSANSRLTRPGQEHSILDHSD
jgi:hypothetical protein